MFNNSKVQNQIKIFMANVAFLMSNLDDFDS